MKLKSVLAVALGILSAIGGFVAGAATTRSSYGSLSFLKTNSVPPVGFMNAVFEPGCEDVK